VAKQTPTSREVAMAAIDAAGSGLSDDFVACFSDDLDFWFPGSTPISGRRHGLPAFMDYLEQVAGYLDELIVLELTNVVVTGEWVFAEASGHGVTKKKAWTMTTATAWSGRCGTARSSGSSSIAIPNSSPRSCAPEKQNYVARYIVTTAAPPRPRLCCSAICAPSTWRDAALPRN